MSKTSPRLLWFVAVLVALSGLEVAGNVTANITFNFWMRDFPYGSQTVTVNYICAFFYVALFLPMALATIVRDVRRYGAHRVLRLVKPRHVVNGLLIALADTWINIAQTYSSGRSTVITQMFAKGTEPIITFALTKLILRDARSLIASPLPLVAFTCSIAAVVLHLYSSLSKHNNKTTGFFIALYYSSVLGSSCYAIAQGRFMRQAHAEFDEEDSVTERDDASQTVSMRGDDDTRGSDERRLLVSHPADSTPPPPPSAVIRSLALALDCVFTLLITLVVVPFLDVIPHFGYSKDISDVWANFVSGCHCLFYCDQNLLFGLITCGAWALVYFADTYMNHYSPTLNAMINQFTAPVGVIVLFVYPAWALGSPPPSDAGAVVKDVASAVLLCLGAVTFARYEMNNDAHDTAIVSAPKESAPTPPCGINDVPTTAATAVVTDAPTATED